MRWIRLSVFILLVTILQASNLLDLIAVTELHIKPDFLLILMVFLALNCSYEHAIITSFATGFAADLIGSVMGPYIISFGCLGSLVAHIRSVITVNNVLLQSVTIFVTSILVGILAQVLSLLKGQAITFDTYTMLFGRSLYSAVFWPFVFWFYTAVGNWLGLKRYRFSRS